MIIILLVKLVIPFGTSTIPDHIYPGDLQLVVRLYVPNP